MAKRFAPNWPAGWTHCRRARIFTPVAPCPLCRRSANSSAKSLA
jgi:hypothetical protein